MSGLASYGRAEAYLLGTIDETLSRKVSYDLVRMETLLRELGNPHRAYPTIHVGGTSGKGSTSTMIAAVLTASGKRTGLHTKPHLSSMTERARIDGLPVPPQRFAELLDAMMPAIERTSAQCGRPSYYETLLALAFEYFARETVDVAVIEVGLGGRLDGTNVIVPEVAVITSIGLDHTDVLGGTIEAIAREKGGIAKPGVPLVVAAVQPAALAAIAQCAVAAGAPMAEVRDVVKIEPAASVPQAYAQAFALVTASARYDVRLGVLGLFQRANAATAVAALERLGTNLRPSRDAMERGLARVEIAGRMELFAGSPPVIFDIAHNVEKAEQLVESLRDVFPGRRVAYVVAIGESKDARQILAALHRLPGTYVFTSFEAAGRPAIAPERLAAIAASIGGSGRAIADPVKALAVARAGAGPGDVVVVTGSTFVVARLREWWMARRAPHARVC
jgi:dihydrofolate synthase/folylpolyglutamate synthase